MKLLVYLPTAMMLFAVNAIGIGACQKAGYIPVASKPAALTVVNVIPGSNTLITVLNSSSPIEYFLTAPPIFYGGFMEYSPPAGNDTAYVVQQNSDTLDISPKATGLMFYNILNLKAASIYSLFLTGSDTSSPDYIFTTDTLPFYSSADSVTGIRFVNLSTGSSPISINLEGNIIGSEVGNLPYKGLTSFKQYMNNSTTQDYLFVIRDAATGDSVTQFDFFLSGSHNNGFGLTDPNNNNNLLTFKNVTLAIYGSEANGSPYPLSVMLVDDY